MRILVCGGRDFDDWGKLYDNLDDYLSPDLIIIQGGAKGADFLARVWAKHMGVEWHEYPADWMSHGKAAGHIRNKQMLDEGNPDLVIAFPVDEVQPIWFDVLRMLT